MAKFNYKVSFYKIPSVVAWIFSDLFLLYLLFKFSSSSNIKNGEQGPYLMSYVHSEKFATRTIKSRVCETEDEKKHRITLEQSSMFF